MYMYICVCICIHIYIYIYILPVQECWTVFRIGLHVEARRTGSLNMIAVGGVSLRGPYCLFVPPSPSADAGVLDFLLQRNMK